MKLPSVPANLRLLLANLRLLLLNLSRRQRMIVFVGGQAGLLLLIVGVFFLLRSIFSGEAEVVAEPAAAETPIPITEVGVSDDRVLFGQSAAFSGPTQNLGWNMRAGIQAAFEEANRQGGVYGRMLELVFRDDAYEPGAALTNTIGLIEDDQVFALIGAVGTPTSRAAIPTAAAAGVPFIAPFTGAHGFLRDLTFTNVINLRASYNDETEEMVAQLTDRLSIRRVAVMYQDDSFGRAGLDGVRNALKRRNMEVVATGIYPRNTAAVKMALLDIRGSNPQAVIIIGTPAPVAALVTWAKILKPDDDMVFITTSFAGSNELLAQLGDNTEDVFVTQVVPPPTDESLPVVVAYQAALAALPLAPNTAVPVPDAVSLEGYLAGRLAIEGLRRCGPDLTRERFLDSITGGGPIDIDGFRLSYGANDSQGSDTIFLAAIDDTGRYHSIDSLKDAVQ